ncbi:MAG: hypothetical protein D4S01_04835 [Dehalococcoidia bacterium]|nr:MAG: hypothetical protein D4S01_04835 [Dehalococcoidia bacterium]
MIIHNNKAIAVPLVIVLVAIVTISVIASSNIIIHFVSFTEKYERALASSALADLGIQRSVYMIQEGLVVVPEGTTDHSEIIEGSDIIGMDILCNSLSDYTITSTAGNRTIKVSYINARITDWR